MNFIATEYIGRCQTLCKNETDDCGCPRHWEDIPPGAATAGRNWLLQEEAGGGEEWHSALLSPAMHGVMHAFIYRLDYYCTVAASHTVCKRSMGNIWEMPILSHAGWLSLHDILVLYQC